ncbi:TPA: hypothetical protein L4E58_001305 [Pseudomonas aeruginosa]|nr:hypothetical protein [Pseudomonas aeruginosa]
MTESKICTCPSGDGSLRWPCPAHPAVDQADVAAKLTFINGRPAMCGCQVEYSDGGGEYSDVIYVTLCAKHSGSVILDLVATNRIALTPEYEGQWHADLYLDREIPLAKAEGATPAEAVLALMSAERIDPEQGGVDQAGGDRWDALQSIMEWTAAENIPDDRKLCLIRNAARAALAQPSPCKSQVAEALRVADWSNTCIGNKALILAAIEQLEAQPSPAQAEQAEAERPEVVARVVHSNPVVLDHCGPLNANDELMTVAQHERIVEARWNRAMDLLLDHVSRISEKFKAERDAALARVEQQERTIAGMNEAHAKLAGLYEAAQARVAELEHVLRVVVNAADHGSWPTTVMHGIEKVREVLAGSASPVKAQPEETPGEILAAKLIETWVAKHGKPAPWSKIVEITALATNMPNDERDRLLALDDDVDAQAQLSVPDGYRLIRLEHFAAIKAQLNPEQVDAYRGRNIYDEDKVYANWNACRSALDEIKDVFQQIDWDAENELAELLAAGPGKEGV